MIAHENAADLTAAEKRPDGYFYIAWILWTTFCIPIAYFIVILLMLIVALFIGDTIYVNGVEHITEDYLGIYFVVPVTGLLTGAVQYGMLRRILPRMGGWVLATAGGWLLGMFLVGAFLRLHWIVMAQMGLTFLPDGAFDRPRPMAGAAPMPAWGRLVAGRLSARLGTGGPDQPGG